MEQEDIVGNLGPSLPGQKIRICHLERLDLKALTLRRSGTAENEAVGVDTGEWSVVCIMNGELASPPALAQTDSTTLHSFPSTHMNALHQQAEDRK